MLDKISIKTPMKVVTAMCKVGIHDSVRHSINVLETLDDNGSYEGSRNLRIECLRDLLDEIAINEMMVMDEIRELRG